MKKSTKAALFSLLIFPGVGHFILRRWLWGFLFFATALLASGVLFTEAVDQAMNAMDRMMSGEVSIDRESLQRVIEEQRAVGTKALFLRVTKYLLVVSWVVAGIDAYVQGKRSMETSEESSERS